MKYIDDLVHWMVERESIRMQKEANLPPPWTSDPIMANHRWCNVHREDDKVTRFIHQEWLQPGLMEYIPIALCVARLVNWPPTLKLLGYPHKGWTPEYRAAWLEAFGGMRSVGVKAWTGAYMVTGGFSKGGETKESIIARVLDGANMATKRWPMLQIRTLADAAKGLQVPGIGSFLAAQVVADLKHTVWLKDAPDWHTWCAPGPGSTMGLNFIFDRPRTTNLSPLQFQMEVLAIQDIIASRLGLNLCAQNTQNCLCELSKYVRAKYFNERLKNSYHATRDIANRTI